MTDTPKLHAAFNKVLAAANKIKRQTLIPKRRHELAEAISVIRQFTYDHGEFINNCDTEE